MILDGKSDFQFSGVFVLKGNGMKLKGNRTIRNAATSICFFNFLSFSSIEIQVDINQILFRTSSDQLAYPMQEMKGNVRKWKGHERTWTGNRAQTGNISDDIENCTLQIDSKKFLRGKSDFEFLVFFRLEREWQGNDREWKETKRNERVLERFEMRRPPFFF